MPSQTTADHHPDYPPKTPPPPKKPISPPRPDTGGGSSGPGTVAATGRRGVAMRNRRGVNWPMDNAPWTTAKARRRVLVQLAEWGHRLSDPAVEVTSRVVQLVVTAALADESKRISVHLTDQDEQACILALSHGTDLTAGYAPGGDRVLTELGTLPVVSSCGTDIAPDGRRIWAVVNL
ncbi:hypothetical protein [Streptomyces sp. NPDC060366]|uniref:hypothetical protein n=1 Tax=Streptomyces sp. NPDC060366 TaxID=3347105 RepID=UPI003656A141